MMASPFKNAVAMAHALLTPYIPTARVIVDMTCGNGYDTVFLASHMQETGRLYAFDIQERAITATKRQLADHNLADSRICCRCGSHDVLLAQLEENPDIIVFNLGYLPHGDHAVHTKSEITVKALKICLNKIAINGIIMIAAYPGTEPGAQEEQAVRSLLQQVPQAEFDVSSWRPVNQVHCPPVLYMVQKRG